MHNNPPTLSLDEMRKRHGGYWRYSVLDFYYLYNHHFPPKGLYDILRSELPTLLDYYPSTQRVLAELLAQWKADDYFKAEHLVVGNGSSELIKILMRLPQKITVPLPTFNEFTKVPPERLHLVPLREDDHFRLDVKRVIQEAQESRSDYLVIVNPNNPVGNVVSPNDIEIILKTGVRVIVDEAFIDWAGLEYSCEPLVAKYQNLIVLKSLTKVAGTAGLRLAYMLTSDRALVEQVRQELPIWNVNSIAERYIELFPQFQKEFLESITLTLNDRAYLMEQLRTIAYLEPFESYANFIFCKTHVSAHALAQFLYDQHSIMIKEGLNQNLLKTDQYVRFGARPVTDTNTLMSVLRDYNNNHKEQSKT